MLNINSVVLNPPINPKTLPNQLGLSTIGLLPLIPVTQVPLPIINNWIFYIFNDGLSTALYIVGPNGTHNKVMDLIS